MMVDLDRIKRYNDRYGHQQGDACLQAVCAVLGRFVRWTGDVAASPYSASVAAVGVA